MDEGSQVEMQPGSSTGSAEKTLLQTAQETRKDPFYKSDPRVDDYFERLSQVHPENDLLKLYDDLVDVKDVVANTNPVGILRKKKITPAAEQRIEEIRIKLEIISRLVLAYLEPPKGQTPLTSLNEKSSKLEKEILEMDDQRKRVHFPFAENVTDLLTAQAGSTQQ